MVTILLATLNGEDYLKAQLESIAAQTYENWQLVVGDDGSTDGTISILEEFSKQYPEQVTIIKNDPPQGSAKDNFISLIQNSYGPYFMFCDQDDIWAVDKVSRQYQAIMCLQERYGAMTPLLVHSDLQLIDERRQTIADSFWQVRHFDLAQERQNYLLTNTVSGCASVFNRAAATKAFPLPVSVAEHDRWLALVCAWFGRIESLSDALVAYRQHNDNAIGAGGAAYRHVSAQSVAIRVDAWFLQADAFLRRYGDELSAEDYRLVEALANLRFLQGWERRKRILQHKLFKRGVLANLALLCFA